MNRCELAIPHGALVLPERLVLGNEEQIPVAWSATTGRCGPLQLTAHCDRRDGLRCRIEALNLSPEPVMLRELAWTLELDQPERIELRPECGIATREPWDFNLTHETLTNRHLALRYGGETLYLQSDDPMAFLRCEPLDARDPRLRVTWHRLEPHWDYNGLFSTHPRHGLLLYEGQTCAASLAITSTPPPPVAADRRRATPATCEVLDKIASFRIAHGEYAGLFAGGYDHRNRRLLEPHVNRAEYGEMLLHEFRRTGDPQLWQWTITFAERFQQLGVNRSLHPERGGAVRGRYGDHVAAHPIRSMRGAAFFWDMAERTGREDYRQTALGIARYLCRVFPWTNARQGAAVRDLMRMFRATGEEVYRTVARRIIATIAKAQLPDGGWYEYWDARGEATVYDPPHHHGGEWVRRACLKPEMASYNLNGILDALRISQPDDLPGAAAVAQQAADWMARVQSSEGAWRFPQFNSRGLYGYGLFQDAAAMLKAGQYFRDNQYITAGRRAIAYGRNLLATDHRIPAVIGVSDLDQTESSFTCFYALEALALEQP